MTAPNPNITGGLSGGGAGIGQAHASITLNTSGLAQGARVANGIAAQITQSFSGVAPAARQAATGVQQFSAALGSLQGIARLAIGGFAVRQIVQATVAFTELGVQVRRAGTAMTQLAGDQGRAITFLRAIQRASGGTVDNLEAMRIANQAMALGLANSSEEFERLVRAARGVTFVSPVIHDVQSAITELALASANLSFRRLDQLGLSVTEVRRRMAELQRENKGLTDSNAFLQASVEVLNEKYGELADKATSGMEKLGAATRSATQEMAAQGTTLDNVAGGLAGYINNLRAFDQATRIASTDTTNLTSEQRQLRQQIEVLLNPFNRLSTLFGELPGQMKPLIDAWDRLAESIGAANLQAQAFAGTGVPVQLPSQRGGIIAPNAVSIGVQQSQAAFDAQIRGMRTEADAARKQAGDEARAEAKKAADIASDRAQRISEIERQAGQQRIDETRSYEERRTETIRQYEQTIAREAEDFARQRARAQETLNRQIAKSQADFDERLQELREDSASRIADLQEDAAKDRERRERDHRNNILDAAARLDAVALVKEQQRFAEQEQERKEDLDERLRDERDNLQERTEEDRKAHEERLQEMRDDFDLQRQIEAEDRQIRLDRQAQDHLDQLTQLDAAHVLRLAQIDRQAGDERTRAELAHADRLAELDSFNAAYLRKEQERNAAVLAAAQTTANKLRQTGPIIGPQPRPTTEFPRFLGGFQTGGMVTATGMAYLHAGERVIPSSGSSSRSLSVGQIVVNAAPGQNAGDIAQAVRREVIGLLREVSA